MNCAGNILEPDLSHYRRLRDKAGPCTQAELKEARWSRMRALPRRLFIDSDTTTIRVIMAVSSALFALGLALPFDTMARPAFAHMGTVAPGWAWAILFIAHTLGVFWRLADETPRVGWGFAINAFGLVVWIVSTGLITTTVGVYSPGTAMEITVIAAAFVALVRTGLNEEKFSP